MKPVVEDCGAGSVHLRLLREDDLPRTLSWRNRDDVRVWLKTKDRLTMQQHATWFAWYLDKDDDLMFIVEETASSEMVGQVAIYDINRVPDEAEIGRFIAAPGHSGKGHMRDAIGVLIGLAFKGLHLRRLWLEVIKTNARAIRLYDGCGFVRSGIVGDLIIMERLAPGSPK